MSTSVLLTKARRYCSVQERCHQEVRDKLYTWGAHRTEVEQVIGQLIGDGFLNEQRFAEHYAVSKFRQKGWGRVKIREALKFKKVSGPCIVMGLNAIEEEEYRTLLAALVKRRWAKEKGLIEPLRRQRVIQYLLGRGFEYEEIGRVLKSD